MADSGPNEHGLTESVRKDLIDYYKWIVNLATFVLTISVSLVGLLAHHICYKRLLVAGWVLLGLCIFLNWVLVKRLVTMPIVSSLPFESAGLHYRIFKASYRNLKSYGLIQNWAFLVGVFLVSVALILNMR